jgi:hypothetical protein
MSLSRSAGPARLLGDVKMAFNDISSRVRR